MYYTAENATIVGDVRLGDEASIWYGAVLRGDLNTIDIGERTNIQDLSIIHVDATAPVTIGSDCVIGHRCILHGCTIEDEVLIGMGSILMDHTVIGKGSIVGAGALVLEGTIIPPGSLVVGSPAKVIRTASPEQQADILRAAREYVQHAKEQLKEGTA